MILIKPQLINIDEKAESRNHLSPSRYFIGQKNAVISDKRIKHLLIISLNIRWSLTAICSYVERVTSLTKNASKRINTLETAI